MWLVSVSGGSEANNLRLVEAERCMLIRPMWLSCGARHFFIRVARLRPLLTGTEPDVVYFFFVTYL